MTARTQVEVYRPFTGAIAARRLRFLPLLAAEIRVAAKNRIALLILFAPVFIATVILSFIVYGKFALQSGVQPAGTLVAVASSLIEVRTLIISVFFAMGYFAMLVIAWYGSGLIAEDRRLGAHTLYFARPLTRLDYFAAKLATVAFFGAMAVLAPSLIICLVAVFSSPDWAFLRQEGRLLWQVVAFSAIWITLMSSIVLCISSVVPRKTFGLVAVFGLFPLTKGVSELLADVQRDPRFRAISPDGNLQRIAAQIFDTHEIVGIPLTWDPSISWVVLAATLAIAWTITSLRIRRMETS